MFKHLVNVVEKTCIYSNDRTWYVSCCAFLLTALFNARYMLYVELAKVKRHNHFLESESKSYRKKLEGALRAHANYVIKSKEVI